MDLQIDVIPLYIIATKPFGNEDGRIILCTTAPNFRIRIEYAIYGLKNHESELRRLSFLPAVGTSVTPPAVLVPVCQPDVVKRLTAVSAEMHSERVLTSYKITQKLSIKAMVYTCT